MNIMDILSLSNLLKDQSYEYIDGHDVVANRISPASQESITPASFGRSKTNDKALDGEQLLDCVDKGEIWSSDEIPCFTKLFDDPNDGRDEPIYQIYFKQEVGTEDVFLGTDRSPASYDCTSIVVKIHFPNAVINELNVDIQSNCLLAESRDKKLSISLPMEVDDQDGNAKWNAATNQLTINLPLAKMF